MNGEDTLKIEKIYPLCDVCVKLARLTPKYPGI